MRLRILLILALLMLSGITAPSPENTTDPEHPFAKHLASLYIKYLNAAKEGDVSSALDKMISEYAAMSSVITPELLKGMSADELDPLTAQFVKVDASKNIARLFYQKIGQDLKIWQAIVFKLESDKWKIAKIVRYSRDMESEEDGLAILLEDTNTFFLEEN